MAFGISSRPGRWATRCPSDSFDFCSGISPNDFIVTWDVSPFGDTLNSISVAPNPNGLVASITTKPNGTVTDLDDSTVTAFNYSSGDDKWKPAGIEYLVEDGIFYRFSVALSMTLTTGDSCNFTLSSDFQYIDLGSLPTATPTISGIQQVGNQLTGDDGYFDSDGDPQDTAATIRRWYSYTDAAGTAGETYLGAGSTYTLTSSEAQKYIRYKVIPYAVTGPSPGIEGQSPVFGIIAPDTVAATITNDNSGTFTLSQAVSTTSAIGIDWGDGSDLEVFAQSSGVSQYSKAYPSGSKTITIYARAVDITEIDINTQSVTSVDLTNLTGMSSFIAGQNPSLSTVTLPVGNTQTWSDLQLNNCALSGTFDASSISMPASFLLQNNTGLTMITFPNTGMCTQFRADNCNLTGTIDFTGIDIYGNIQIQSNSNLTGITFSTSSGATSNFQAFNCGLTGTLDYSALDCTGQIVISGNSLTGITYASTSAGVTLTCGNNSFTSLDISGYTGIVSFNCSTCTSLTTLTLPASSGTITNMRMQACDLPYVDFTNLTFASNIDFRIFNNSMTAAEVNCILVDLDATFPNSGSGKIRIEGQAAPDGSSGGCDGTTAASNLASEGYTVTTA